MLFKQKNITYSDVITNDFTFTKIDVPKEFTDYLDTLEYAGDEEPSEDIKFKIMNTKGETERRIKELLLEKLDVDKNIKRDIAAFEFGIDKYTKGDGLPLHTDKGRINPYEILLYLPKDDNFVGRDLHVVGPNYNLKVRPIPGLVCFINAFAVDTYHGVTTLESESEIYVIIGGIGINSREWRVGIEERGNGAKNS